MSVGESGEYCILLASIKSIKMCYVKVERRNSIEKSGKAGLYGGITVHWHTLWTDPGSRGNSSGHEPLCQGSILPDERGCGGVVRRSHTTAARVLTETAA